MRPTRAEIDNALDALSLFVDIYDGHVLDSGRGKEAIRVARAALGAAPPDQGPVEVGDACGPSCSKNLSPSHLRLHLGELSAQELRTVRAYAEWRTRQENASPPPRTDEEMAAFNKAARAYCSLSGLSTYEERRERAHHAMMVAWREIEQTAKGVV